MGNGTSPLRSGVNWPVYVTRDYQSARSRAGSLAIDNFAGVESQLFSPGWLPARLRRRPGLVPALARFQAGPRPRPAPHRLRLPPGRLVPGTGGRSPGFGSRTHHRLPRDHLPLHPAQIDRRKDYSWRNLLPRRKAKRGRRGRKGGSSTSFIRHRRHISQRPVEADDRATPGHWEADLMLFGNQGQSLLTLQERYSRLLLTRPLTTKDSPGRGRCHHPTAGSLPSPVAPVRRLRQRHRVRPPLPTPRPGYPDLLLRPPLPLAEGRRGECQRPAAPFPPPQDRPVPVAPRLHLPGHPSPQPHPPQVPGLPDPGRNLIQTTVALEM